MRRTLLPLSCDTHFHVIDSRYPTIAKPMVPVDPASLAEYEQFCATVGIQRSVIVQPSFYGTDNRCLLESLAQAKHAMRGIAVVDTQVGDAELEALHRAGVRGVRFNQIQFGATAMDEMREIAARVRPLGWHIQLHMRAEQLAAHADTLRALPVRLVIDHLGRARPPTRHSDPGWTLLKQLLGEGNTWVKVSGPYHESLQGAPRYADFTEMADELVQLAPDRLFWASDWPYGSETVKPALDPIVDTFWDVVRDDADLAFRILVRNPGEFYGFD